MDLDRMTPQELRELRARIDARLQEHEPEEARRALERVGITVEEVRGHVEAGYTMGDMLGMWPGISHDALEAVVSQAEQK
jgi:hypothetical protein